ncbi:hypothetical protein SYNTR_1547 [Candidatus Syntrophocurvum alkaliphilum]|uniref:Multidrug resistance protein MdtA-like alpha-helical hairpin domain-containing protein n=1 Tax=Candidatus Syntrophocurvum alkaliphilum TaxID=2293317 RepID=A0A6I6DIW1_9FIRM|nr:efflux RND transporter periplasmic adaptor subunit [Candidatus Syntrophocurvum alkaliphilum]QGU00141.1 hypothetical protein SYNTR_1547 [Candidatus Syntrophocurvum alkaliphilum]
MLKNKKFLWGAGIIAIILVVVIAISTSAVSIETIAVKEGNIQRTVTDTGIVQSVTNYDLQTISGGRVADILVEVGQDVSEGQTIALLSNSDITIQKSNIKSQLAQARSAKLKIKATIDNLQSELSEAEKHLNRMEELYIANAISRVEYDEAVLAVDTINQSLTNSNEQLSAANEQVDVLNQSYRELGTNELDLTITSPIDGTIMSLPISKEQVLMPGAIVSTVAVDEQMEIKSHILSDELGGIELGQKVELTAPVLGDESLWGKVTKVYPRAEEKMSALGVAQRRVPVIISLEGTGNLKPGYETTVTIYTQSKEDVLKVPREVIMSLSDGEKQVRFVKDGRVVYNDVETGLSDNYNIEIKQGLNLGDEVITDTRIDLSPNTRVKIK